MYFGEHTYMYLHCTERTLTPAKPLTGRNCLNCQDPGLIDEVGIVPHIVSVHLSFRHPSSDR